MFQDKKNSIQAYLSERHVIPAKDHLMKANIRQKDLNCPINGFVLPNY